MLGAPAEVSGRPDTDEHLIAPAKAHLSRERRVLTAGVIVGGVVLVLGGILGGTLGAVALASVEVLPILAIGWLARLGAHAGWARGLSVAFTWLLLIFAALAALGMAWAAYGQDSPEAVMIGGACLVALGASALISNPPLSSIILRRLHLRDDSVVRLAVLITLGGSLVLLAPLVATGGRSILLDGMVADPELAAGGSPSTLVLPLLWSVPAAFVLAGYGIHRDTASTLARLGLSRPSARQILIGLTVALALVPAAILGGQLLEQLSVSLGIPAYSGKLEQLFSLGSLGVGGALALSVGAGVGEELAVRGLLQPRLGLVLSNVFFASLHAWQYPLHGVLVVFALGLAFGVLRRRTNTVVAMLGHAVYDLALILTVVELGV